MDLVCFLVHSSCLFLFHHICSTIFFDKTPPEHNVVFFSCNNNIAMPIGATGARRQKTTQGGEDSPKADKLPGSSSSSSSTFYFSSPLHYHSGAPGARTGPLSGSGAEPDQRGGPLWGPEPRSGPYRGSSSSIFPGDGCPEAEHTVPL